MRFEIRILSFKIHKYLDVVVFVTTVDNYVNNY